MFLNSVLRERLLRKKGCSKQIPKEKQLKNPWEKSMLSGDVFLVVGSPDDRQHSLVNVNGAKCLD
jgi:hypothetical protein